MKESTAQASEMYSGRQDDKGRGDEWPEELVYDDGVPLESLQHRHQMELFLEVAELEVLAQGRQDYFAGGNMFIYYSREQARFVAENPPPAYRHVTGPDVFFVDGVDPKLDQKPRPAWIVWKENQRYPDLIMELLSPSTQHIDRGVKKRRYAELFRTREYYLYEPGSAGFEAFRLGPGDIYLPVEGSQDGWVWSEVLRAWLGLWQGTHRRMTSTWLRLYDASGRLVLTGMERAEEEHQRAEEERQRAEEERQRAEEEHQRADAAESEVARLRALLAERNERDA